jgi:predicted XRE-type DNA-binding protein
MTTEPFSPADFLAVAATTAPIERELFDGITDPAIRQRITQTTAEREHRHELLTTLASIRQRLGLTQDEVAAAWGRTQPQVSRLERDPTAAQVSTLISYLSALGAHAHLIVEHHGTTLDLELV